VLKIIYIGSSGPLSLIPLQKLLDCGQAVVAVALEADDEPVLQDPRIPLLSTNHGSVASLARLHGIPLIELFRPWGCNVDEMGRYAPDLIVVSCFARKLPQSVLSIPHIGCFNLHPSLLPAYRGPVPLFWQFRAGVKTFGITLHRMSLRLDAGNIVAQTGVAMPDGVSGRQADVLLAEAGSEMLIHALRKSGRDRLSGSAQDEGDASYQGLPSASDYTVSVSWSAQRLYNFICATRDRGVRYPCRIDNRIYWLLEADAWQRTGEPRLVVNGNRLSIPCQRGSVTARFQTD